MTVRRRKGKTNKVQLKAENGVAQAVQSSSPETLEKHAAIEAALSTEDTRALALHGVTKGGFLDDELRQRAWQLLVAAGSNQESETSRERRSKKEVIEEFAMDIERSMYQFSCCKGLSNSEREVERDALVEIVSGVLLQRPNLYYYQGFHDICTVFLHVFGKTHEMKSSPNSKRKSVISSENQETATLVASEMAAQHFGDHHRSDFSTTIQSMETILVILKFFDYQVFQALDKCKLTPMFALSWIITGFAHSVEDIDVVKQLYDAFLSSHPMLPYYMTVAMMLRPHTRRRLLRISKEDGTMPSLHHFLQNVPPPNAPPTKGSGKRRSRKYRAWRKKNQVAAFEGFVNGQQVAESREEEKENCVDRLVEQSLAMMSCFPPEDVLYELKAEKAVQLPTHSVLCLPVTHKPTWKAVLEHAAQHFDTSFLSHRPKRTQHSTTRLYVALATAVGITAYLAWASRSSRIHI